MPADGKRPDPGPATDPTAKRRYVRFNKAIPFRYSILQVRSLLRSARMVNISGGGLCLRSDRAIAKGAIIALEVELPGTDSLIQAIGRVVWAGEAENGMFDHGVHFLWTGHCEREEFHVESLDDVTQRLQKQGNVSLFDD